MFYYFVDVDFCLLIDIVQVYIFAVLIYVALYESLNQSLINP